MNTMEHPGPASQWQETRLLQLHFPNDDGPASELLIDTFHGRESLSNDFEFELHLLSRDALISLKSVMGLMAGVELAGRDGEPRWFNGYVTQFAQAGTDGGFARYRMVLSPWTTLLRRRMDNRIFQNQTLRDTLDQIFAAYGEFADYRVEEVEDASPETFRVQFEESDYNYFNRRCEEKGWFYWFEHRADGHTLVISDNSTVGKPIEGRFQVRYHGGEHFDTDDSVDQWQAQRDLVPAKVSLRSYDFKKPSQLLAGDADTLNDQGKAPRHEVYEYTGAYAYADPHGGDRMAKLRMEEIEAAGKRFNGESDCRRLQPGRVFELIDHFDRNPEQPEESQFFLVEVVHRARNNYVHDQTLEAYYHNDMIALRKKIPFRPGRGHNSHPVRMSGLQTAKIVGPPGEEIWCDEYGRVRIQFPWDRNDFNDDRASCWVRVSNPLSGGQYGGMFLPRIGQEVAVDFLGGNPDLPVVVGRFYNAENMPPWELPAAKNQMGLYSKSVGGGYDNANVFRFDDTPGQEELWMHAELDQRLEIERDESHWVGQDRKKTVDRDEVVQVHRHRTETVDGNETITVLKDRTENVKQNENITVNQNRVERVDLNETLAVGQNQQITIGQNRSETVGQNENVAIGDHKQQTIGKTYIQNVGLAKMTNVGLGYSINVGAGMNTLVTLTQTEQVGLVKRVNVGRDLVVEAGTSITLKTGDARLIMKKNGDIELRGSGNVIVKGNKIKEN